MLLLKSMSISDDISIATEILAIKLSKNIFNTKELNNILKEKELVLLGDKDTIEKVINVYGREIKGDIKNAGN